MSSRNFRKLTKDSNALPPPDDDEEYEPTCSRTTKHNFTLLGVESHSSHSEKENDTDSPPEAAMAVSRKKNKKKKKGQAKNKAQRKNSISGNLEEMDEIDRSLLEVDALLGPAPPAPVVVPPPPPDPRVLLMAVKPRYLSPEEEMNRIFGPEEDQKKKRGRHDKNQWLKRIIALPPIEVGRAIHFMNGLSMSLYKRENDILYFTYNHNRELQKMHRSLLLTRAGRWGSTNVTPQSLDDPTHAHMEGLIDTMDILFALEQYSVAKVLVEQALTHMQRVADNLFNITNPKVRLEYKFRENRAFHILVLKQMYLVGNRACHRTALELAKVLMNLDPSDPLAVLLIIDTLAIRAREHQWLIDAVEIWTKDRNADCLFNIQYSNALAHFHVISNKGGDIAEADKLLQVAIFGYPTLVIKLYECCSIPIDAKMRDHPLFKETKVTNNLEDLMTLYAKLGWSRWKETPVIGWFTRNVEEVIAKYEDSVSVQESAKRFKNKRMNLFQVWPNEIIRHLSIIKPMSFLLADGAVPDVGRHCPFNPSPPFDSIDRYKYDGPPPYGSHRNRQSIFYNLFNSMLPTHNPYLEPMRDEEDDQPFRRGDMDIGELLLEENVVRVQPRPYPIEPDLEENLQHLINIGTENYDPRTNNLINSASEVRNAFVTLLGELFDNLNLNNMEHHDWMENASRERGELREVGETGVINVTNANVATLDSEHPSVIMQADEIENKDETEEELEVECKHEVVQDIKDTGETKQRDKTQEEEKMECKFDATEEQEMNYEAEQRDESMREDKIECNFEIKVDHEDEIEMEEKIECYYEPIEEKDINEEIEQGEETEKEKMIGWKYDVGEVEEMKNNWGKIGEIQGEEESDETEIQTEDEAEEEEMTECKYQANEVHKIKVVEKEIGTGESYETGRKEVIRAIDVLKDNETKQNEKIQKEEIGDRDVE